MTATMMHIVDDETSRVVPVPKGNSPNYDKDNPVWILARMVQ